MRAVAFRGLKDASQRYPLSGYTRISVAAVLSAPDRTNERSHTRRAHFTEYRPRTGNCLRVIASSEQQRQAGVFKLDEMEALEARAD